MAMGAGLMLAGALPRLNLAGFAWIAPGVLLLSTAGIKMRQAWRVGYVGGLTFWLCSLDWLLAMPFPVGAVSGWLALSAYLALFPAIWIWTCWRFLPEPSSPMSGSLWHWLSAFDELGWTRRLVWAWFCAASWVALEMLRSRLLTGFPWNTLGVSQHRMLPLVQIASLTGVYGISFLMIWFSTALVGAVAVLAHRPQSARWVSSDLVLPLLVLGLTLAFGITRMRQTPAVTDTLKIALIQPSIPQTLIWNPDESTNRFQRLLDLSEQAMESKPQLVIWPEAAVPNLLRYDPWVQGAVTNLAIRHRVWMIIGSDDAQPSAHPSAPDDADYFNASFLIDPTGRLRARYCKQRLVVFGEYLPLQPWLFFLKWFTPVRSGFVSGTRPVPFSLDQPECRCSVLICFEDTFATLARQAADPDTDFLVNLTNNGWFGETAAQWQHAANAVFRAVENDIPLVRCSNNGLTCWVDRRGQMHQVYFDDSQDIYRAGFKLVEVPLRDRMSPRAPTFYQRHGDWFGWGCGGAVLGTLVLNRITRRPRAIPPSPNQTQFA
jgi:apolipoprotein N-acyltransferase